MNSNRTYQPRFKGVGEVKEIDRGDYIEKHIVTEATTGRKWGVGIASSIFAGLGQFMNGDIGKGIAFLSADILITGLYFTGRKGLAHLLNLPIGIWSIVDAVKNAKSETVQIVNKGE